MGLGSQVVGLIDRQNAFFRSGHTRSAKARQVALDTLLKGMKAYESRFLAALKQDLGKSEFEAYASEIGITYEEIRFARKKVKRWMRVRKVPTPLFAMPGKSEIHYKPYGVALILSPWNYPLQLALMPAVAALAAGNTVLLKPSEFAPATAQAMEDMVRDFFEPDLFALVQGEADVAQQLIDAGPDYLFFTGSTAVGKKIMSAASEQLIPLTLELGGKSPALVQDDADVEVAARRIVWGKFLNAGQTCVAPDYVMVSERFKTQLIDSMKHEVGELYGNAAQSDAYGRIVNERHFDRLMRMLEGTDAAEAGHDRDRLHIEPAILDIGHISDNDAREHSTMKEEIFGPILPVLSYDSVEEARDFVVRRPAPLAAYVFTRNGNAGREWLGSIQAGGGCVNDTIMHLTSPHLPFGGVGPSGHGSYHGEAGFQTFSHAMSVMDRMTRPDIRLRYPPYGERVSLLRKLLG